jgi:hypothetical protein
MMTPQDSFRAPEESGFSKVAFVLLVILGFAIVLRATISLVGYLMLRSQTQKIVNGMVDGNSQIIVPQDPSAQGARTIFRSVNEEAGIEFTWSVWMFIENMSYNSGQYKVVFYKGNEKTQAIAETSPEQPQGINFPNNAPGLYIAPNSNKLVVMMNTFTVINEEVTVDDVPVNKWVNVIIRCRNNVLDVYVNGTIVKSHRLAGVPKQNYGDVYVGTMGGFAGNLSNLWYYNYAVSAGEIASLQERGPDITMSGASGAGVKDRDSDYLSLRWFFRGMAS